MLLKKQVTAMLAERDKYLTEGRNSTQHYRVDEIEDEIMADIRGNFEQYEADFIIETLTRFGDAPSILYDDNGLFAISSWGLQEVVTGKNKIKGSMTFWVEKPMWKKTIRNALKYYLKSLL